MHKITLIDNVIYVLVHKKLIALCVLSRHTVVRHATQEAGMQHNEYILTGRKKT